MDTIEHLKKASALAWYFRVRPTKHLISFHEIANGIIHTTLAPIFNHFLEIGILVHTRW